MTTMVKFCSDDKGEKEKTAEMTEKAPLLSLSLEQLYKLIEQHKAHLAFLKDVDMIDEQKQKDIVSKIEHIFGVINKKTELDTNINVS